MKLSVPNAILFVLDPTNETVEIPDYQALVSRTGNCVSVGTQADVDGETKVFLSRDVPDGLTCVFDGIVGTPGGHLGIKTSEDVLLHCMEGLELNTPITVWVDDERWPSCVSVVVAA